MLIFVVNVILLFLFGLLLHVLEVTGSRAINNMVSFWERIYQKVTGRNFRLNLFWRNKSLPPNEKEILFEYIPFYRHLTLAERENFDYRLIKFRKGRKFIGREGLDVSEKMKLLISATAVKLTFGMRSYMLREFETIIIYPQQYLNKKTNNLHKGEVNTNGVVVLSWEDFYAGIKITDDSLNLGLHEFAHTLALQRLKNPAFSDSFFKDNFDKLMHHVNNPALRLALQKRAQLRHYALKNSMEFFAVATEAFFENPQDLYVNHRVIYKLFTEMYNLNLIKVYSQPIAINETK